MVFWIGILIAVGFAYSAIKLGFYHAWTMLFNVVVAVYLGIRLGPAVADFVPMSGEYRTTLAVLGTAVGTFLVLHGISYVFLLGQFEVTFPRVFNTLGSGLVGFLAGFLMWSFATLVICTTPFCQNASFKDIGFDSKKFEEAKMQPYLVWWCNFVDKLVVSGDSQPGAEQAIKSLLAEPAGSGTKAVTFEAGSADTNKPCEPGVAEGLRPPQGVLRRGEPNYPRRTSGRPSSPNETQPHTVIPP